MPTAPTRPRARSNGSTKARPEPAPALPMGKHEEIAGALGLPEPHPESYAPFVIQGAGTWLVISDIHAPYHDRATLELAAAEAKRRGVAGVLFNGDTLDSHEVSSHDKEPSAPRYVSEIETGRKLFAWFRAQLPKARFVVKQGNHEDRLERYIIQRAPALFGLEGLDLPSLLHLANVGAEWVSDKRVITLGKLAALHGHEYRGSGGASPARWLFLRTQRSAICGHFHRTSEHGERDVMGREQRTWTTGCACYLFPAYCRLNQWNHGFAFVDLAADGTFAVDNRRVRDGKIA